MDRSRLHAALAALLADHGRAALLALALACAEVVLPLYEAHHMGDDRLRRALSPRRQPEDLKAASKAMAETLRVGSNPQACEAAVTVYAAVSLLFWHHDDVADVALLRAVGDCVHKTADLVAAALENDSAQERLDFLLHSMAGTPSFEEWLRRNLNLAGAACG